MQGNQKTQLVTIVFRALNEEKWFENVLEACEKQVGHGAELEFVLVDSGSTDRTLEIAARHGCRILHIRKSDFSFGRSANYGCDAATGDYIVLISAHCIPVCEHWLSKLVAPLMNGDADYVYGRQIGHPVTRFSEHQVFAQYFGEADKLPQIDFFCNNANAVIRKTVWAKHRFDESVTGLEDMVLAKAIMKDGGRIGYVANAPVVHIHEETFTQVRRRYYREALTMREIMPEVHFHFVDFVRCILASAYHDFSKAFTQRVFSKEAAGILGFRFMQYWGTYRGHNEHRILSRAQKESYYYPRPNRRRIESTAAVRGQPLVLGSRRANP